MSTAPDTEFPFIAEIPKSRSRKPPIIDQVKSFLEETGGGAVPVPIAVAALGVSRVRVHQLINDGKLRAFKVKGSNVVLVSIDDIEDRIANPPDVGGRRPAKEK